MSTCMQHTPVRDTTGSLRMVAGDLVDDTEHRWICRWCDEVLVPLPSDPGKRVFHDGIELVRPAELVAS